VQMREGDDPYAIAKKNGRAPEWKEVMIWRNGHWENVNEDNSLDIGDNEWILIPMVWEYESSLPLGDFQLHHTPQNLVLRIQQIINNTCRAKCIGKGKDSHGIKGITGFKVTKVEQITNSIALQRYILSCNKIAEDIKKYAWKVKPVKFDCYSEELYNQMGMKKEINEVFLFHGASCGTLKVIAENGFEEKYSQNCLFGYGCYLTENSSKADEYVPKEEEDCCILLSRVCLGHHIYVDKPWEKDARLPPCVANTKIRYHSVVANSQNKGSKQAILARYREFVIFDGDHIYPQYLIHYKRSKNVFS